MDELTTKRMELIGKRFKYSYPETYHLIEREFKADSPEVVAIQLEEYFTQTFEQLEEETQQEYDDWLEKYEASMDPPMDKYHYLRPEI